MPELAQLLTAPPARAAGMKSPAPVPPDGAVDGVDPAGFSAMLTAATQDLDTAAETTPDSGPDDRIESAPAVAVSLPLIPPLIPSTVTLPSAATAPQFPSPEAAIPPTPVTDAVTTAVPMKTPTAEPSSIADPVPATLSMSSGASKHPAPAAPPPAVPSRPGATIQATETLVTPAATVPGRPAAPAIQSTSTTPVTPAMAMAPGDSPDANAGEGSKGDTPRQPAPGIAISQKFNLAPVEQGPFRLETISIASTVPEHLAEVAEMPLPAAAAPLTPTGEVQMPVEISVADISIEPGEGQRLDVTLAAATPDAAARLRAESTTLEADLAALGAEVEAIRVELRTVRGPDSGVGGGSGSSTQTWNATQHGQADAQGQQGGAYRQQGAAASAARVLLAGTSEQDATARVAPTGGGKVDRYA
ncbi:MAG: hypothetical protein WCZ66_07490 [Sphingomonadaceae bacterium]